MTGFIKGKVIMMNIDNDVNWCWLWLQIGVAGACVMYLSGCAALAGVKSYESGTDAGGKEYSRIEFISGLDLGVSANGIDTVEDKRGIKPSAAKY